MKKLTDILEASPLLGKMINMGGRRAKVTSIAKQGDGRYDTDYEIRFLDDNTKTVLSDPMVRAFMESVELNEARAEDYKLKKTRKEVDKQDGEDDITTQHYDVMLKGKKVGTAEEDDYYGYVDATIHGKTIPSLSGRGSAERQIQKYLKSKRGSKIIAEVVELDEYRRQDVYAIVDKKGKVVAANLTKKNAHKEISRHRDGTIVLDPDAKDGDILKTFAKESVELDEDNTAAIARQVKQAVKKYVTGTPRVQSKGGKVRFIMLRADKIDNELRKMILNVEHPNANVKNMDDIHYANISDRIISAGADIWVKALGLKESAEVEEVANVVGNVAGIGGDTPPVKKKRKKFAGCEVFEVDCEEYTKFTQGSRKKNERWSRRLNMEKMENKEIRSYAHKNPGKAVIIQDKNTGMMCYLKPEKY